MVRAWPLMGDPKMNDPFQADPHPVCLQCQSDNVVADAWVIWNQPTSCWNLHAVYDTGFCLDCETDIPNVMATVSKTIGTAESEVAS